MLSTINSIENATPIHKSNGVIEKLIEQHNDSRLNAINLIVSENRMTPRATAPLHSDIQSRYAAPFYAGTEAANKIIATTTELAKRVFNAEYANLSPISGNMSLLAVVFALSQSGDIIGRIPPFFPGGGYPLDYKIFDRIPLSLAFSEQDWQLDVTQTLDQLQRYKPPLVILGSSIVTYPMPVEVICDFVHQYGGLVGYDGSHTLGLIAGGQYQNPLAEGVDVLFGSTHKTFPGPQGGIILTKNIEVHNLIGRLSNFTPLNGPTLICNPHLARIASTGIVLEETQWQKYALQIIENSRTIAQVLHDGGIPLHGSLAKNYPELTYSHQIIPKYSKPESIIIRDRLNRFNINVDGFVRIGTSEITRLGYTKEQCITLGELLVSLFNNESTNSKINTTIKNLIDQHRSVIL